MKEIVRVRCPVCGMMPTLANLEQTVKTKPAKVRIFVQRLGGKTKATNPPEVKLKRGGAPGVMEYEDVTDNKPDQVHEMETFFDGRIKEYQEGKK